MRICVLTAGHLSTCPRMLKAADAFTGAGHEVRVVSTRHVDWATEADLDVRRKRYWAWQVVDYSAATGSRLRVRSGVRQRAAAVTTSRLGPARAPYGVAVRAFSRVHDELVDEALSAPADFFYGGTTGALAATTVAAQRARVPFGIDLEDFHGGEQEGAVGAAMNAIAARIEERVLPAAYSVTAAGPAIADEYRRAYGVDVVTINNTFPLPAVEPRMEPPANGRLRLYWFSQTIGPSRGLEEAVRAIGISRVPATLALRGRPADGFLDCLHALAREVAAELTLVVQEPAPPDAMIDRCRESDIGLAVEQPVIRNRELCLSNKAFTYMLAGLAVVLTNTPGQRPLAADLGEGALVYEPGRPDQLAEGLRRWYADPQLLVAAKHAAWGAARRRWHWEHPSERGALLAAIPTRS